MTTEAMIERAGDRVVKRWGAMPSEPCQYGHYDCSASKGGECFNEASDKELERMQEERRAFIERLLKEEQEQILVDIITGKVIGKRKDIEG